MIGAVFTSKTHAPSAMPPTGLRNPDKLHPDGGLPLCIHQYRILKRQQ
jgi:hypothetical protein